MACECIKNSEQEILNRLKELHPDRTYEDIELFGSLGFQNAGFSLSGGTFFSHPFKTRYTFIKTNGHVSAPKTETTSIQGAYCPFCGVKRVEDEAEEG